MPTSQRSRYNHAGLLMSVSLVRLRRPAIRLLPVALLATLSFSCEVLTPVTPSSGSVSGLTLSGGPTDGTSNPADFAAELALCVDETNRYRASVGRPPLARSDDLASFAAEAARQDAQKHEAHYYFKLTNGHGIARAENEILWWRGFPIREVVQQGIAQMWRSGPSGEHYDIMVGPYTKLGCGIYVNAGEVTVAQDFR